jgi:hypothetical protein
VQKQKCPKRALLDLIIKSGENGKSEFSQSYEKEGLIRIFFKG